MNYSLKVDPAIVNETMRNISVCVTLTSGPIRKSIVFLNTVDISAKGITYKKLIYVT